MSRSRSSGRRRVASGRHRSGRRGRRGSRAQGAAHLLLLTAPVWVLALRCASADLLAVRGVGPDAAAAAVAAIAWRGHPLTAVAFAVAIGCLGDLASDVPFGLAAARLGVLSAVFARISQLVAGGRLPGRSLLVVGAFAAVERTLAALTYAGFVPQADPLPLLLQAAAVAAYSALLGPVAFAVAATLVPEEPGR